MKILKLLGTLIDYPTEELYHYAGQYIEFIEQEPLLAQDSKKRLIEFFNQRIQMDLLDWQSDYDGLFERGRSLSLLLFEHVHGESRDRGQAMVDLLNTYKQAGLDIGVNELPDHIPLYLEFLSTQGDENAKAWLQDVVHIFGLLASRLKKRENDYQVLFDALIELSGVALDLTQVEAEVATEQPDNTKEALDKVWEEEAVTFGGDAVNGGCPTSVNRPSADQSKDNDVPIQWMEDAIRDVGNTDKAANSQPIIL